MDKSSLACTACNRDGKRAYYSEEMPLINPYTDYPEEHFQACGPLVMQAIGNDRAFVTQTTLKLNRASLVEQRTEQILHVESLLTLWAKEPNDAVKTLYENELHRQYYFDMEFSFIIKGHLEHRGFR